MIKMATDHGAKAIAFDFYMPDNAPIEAVDRFLCGAVQTARQKGLTVLVGYKLDDIDGNLRKGGIAPNLNSETCLPLKNQGHLMGYADWDGTIRQIPLYFFGSKENEAISLKLATIASEQIKLPSNGLVQFVEPSEEIKPISYDELLRNPKSQDVLRDQVVLVGELSDEDNHPTPFGVKPGLIIHALTIDSLRQNRYIERVPAWSSFLIIVVLCYLMAVLANQNARLRRLVYANLIFTALLIAMAALAMYLWLLWIDVIYPVAAIWLLLPLIWGLRKIATRAAAPTVSNP